MFENNDDDDDDDNDDDDYYYYYYYYLSLYLYKIRSIILETANTIWKSFKWNVLKSCIL